MSSGDRAPYPDWIPTAEDWFAREAIADRAEAPRSFTTGSTVRGDGGTEVAGICFRSWRHMSRWPRDLVAYLSAALSG